MATKYIKAIFDGGLKQYVPAPNQGYMCGDVTLQWGVDKFQDAVVPASTEVAYGEIVKITAYNEYGATIEPIVNADTAPKFAVVVNTQNGAKTFPAPYGGAVPSIPLSNVPLSIWVVGLGATPEKDQNGEIVVAYSGDDVVGTDLTGTALYTPKIASDTDGVNGTATKTSTNNLALGLVAVGKVFGTATGKMIRVRVGGKI